MRNLLFIGCALLLCGSTAYAQGGNSDRCEVAALDITGKKVDDIDKGRAIHLGTFDTVIGEEVETTKSYRLPNTRLFVIATVWYTDESMVSGKGADSISLELAVSTTQKRDVLGSLIYADSEMPLEGFEVGRVTTMIKAERRTIMLVMECRKHVRD